MNTIGLPACKSEIRVFRGEICSVPPTVCRCLSRSELTQNLVGRVFFSCSANRSEPVGGISLAIKIDRGEVFALRLPPPSSNGSLLSGWAWPPRVSDVSRIPPLPRSGTSSCIASKPRPFPRVSGCNHTPMSSGEEGYEYEGLSPNAGLGVRVLSRKIQPPRSQSRFSGSYVSRSVGE